MNVYIYWDNSRLWHGTKLAEIKAADILTADKLFEQQTGINPAKNSKVACTIQWA